MAVGYTACETAVANQIYTHFETYLESNRDLVQQGDSDTLYEVMFAGDHQYGIYLQYGGGNEQERSPFAGDYWIWNIVGGLLIRLMDNSATMEVKMRTMIDELRFCLGSDHTLGQTAPSIRIVNIDIPDIGSVNDMPYYIIPFLIIAVDK